jgi:hypothetical protein
MSTWWFPAGKLTSLNRLDQTPLQITHFHRHVPSLQQFKANHGRTICWVRYVLEQLDAVAIRNLINTQHALTKSGELQALLFAK